jgi:hypothetical protein
MLFCIAVGRACYWAGRFESLAAECADHQQSLRRRIKTQQKQLRRHEDRLGTAFEDLLDDTLGPLEEEPAATPPAAKE